MLNHWTFLGIVVFAAMVYAGGEGQTEIISAPDDAMVVKELPTLFTNLTQLLNATTNLVVNIVSTQIELDDDDFFPFMQSYDNIIYLIRDMANDAAYISIQQVALANIKQKLSKEDLVKFNQDIDVRKYVETNEVLIEVIKALKDFYDEALEKIRKNIDGSIPTDSTVDLLWSMIPGYEEVLTSISYSSAFLKGCKRLTEYHGEVTDENLPSLVNFNISSNVYDDETFGLYALLFAKTLTAWELIYPICVQKNSTETVDDYPIVLSIFDMVMGTDNDVNRRNAARGEQIFKGNWLQTKVLEVAAQCPHCDDEVLADEIYKMIGKKFGHLKHPETLLVYQFLVTLGWDFEVYYRAGDLFNYTNFEEPKVGNLLGKAIPQSVPKCKFSKPMSKSIPDNFKKEFCEAHKDAEQGVYKFLVDKCIRFNLALLRLIKSDKGIIPVLSGHDDFDIWKYDLDCSAEGGEKSTRGILVLI